MFRAMRVIIRFFLERITGKVLRPRALSWFLSLISQKIALEKHLNVKKEKIKIITVSTFVCKKITVKNTTEVYASVT